jgi:hypothetical protein
MPETKVAQIVVSALFLSTIGCAPTAPPVGGPQADLKWPPVGSSFVIARTTC